MADIAACPPLTRQSVVEAARRITGYVHCTPALSSSYINSVASTPQTAESLRGTKWEGSTPAQPRLRILLKCENFQRIGAFKPRGAFNAVLRYLEDNAQRPKDETAKPTRVVTHSSGNHAQAVALASTMAGLPAAVVMPSVSSPNKIAATKGYGADVHFSGPLTSDRLAVVDALMADPTYNNVFIPPYDHPDVMLGQGTSGLELQDQAARQLETAREKATTKEQRKSLPSRALDAIIAPCGGGGLLSGTSIGCDGTDIKVFGAEPSFEGADDCCRGLADPKKERIPVVKSSTIADGLRTPIGAIPWSIISDPRYVSGAFSVGEAEICKAAKLVFERMKIVIEPSSAVPLAVALYNEDFRKIVEAEGGEKGWTIGLIVTGGNVTFDTLEKVMATAG